MGEEMSTPHNKEKRAEAKYNHYLDRLYRVIGNKTTYLDELDRAGKKLLGVKFKGVYPSDRIPKLNDLSPYCILNLDKSNEQGSHWIAMAKVPYPSVDTIIYDSFGRNYRRIIPHIQYSGNGSIKNTQLDAEQNITQTDCGARSLAFLLLFDSHGVDTALLI